MHPAALTSVAARPVSRHAPPRRARTGRGDGCPDRDRVRGDGVDFARRTRAALAESHAGAVEAENHRSHRRGERGAGGGQREAGNGHEPAVIAAVSQRAARFALPAVTAVILFVVYTLTLAPGVT